MWLVFHLRALQVVADARAMLADQGSFLEPWQSA
jgi:hypothetical protein